MNTPICDFVRHYAESSAVRLHMPGHKGMPLTGPERLDITEIEGADVLYKGDGIIAQSEANAASLFGTGKTLYSTEGSSLCIRAMVYLARLWGATLGRKPTILAARNAHKAFMSAAALVGMDVTWLMPQEEGNLLSCRITAEQLEQALQAMEPPPGAVYVTSPDYLGTVQDIASLARVCHANAVPLLVDNAHGAYLHFLPSPAHPIDLGADLSCDSAHKTLPVLTGGAYLQIAKDAPALFHEAAEQAMMLFASTSPSYLILQSLDACNRYLSDGYREKLAAFAQNVADLRADLAGAGYTLTGDEAMKITLLTKPYGYTGDELAQALQAQSLIPEFADPDHLVFMLTRENSLADLARLKDTLLAIPQKDPILTPPPVITAGEQVLSIREALFSPGREIDTQSAQGRILASAMIGCPPAIPIAICGERLTQDSIRALLYYGIDRVRVVEE